ncbi:tail protein [Erwinia phage Midgardsormr38]|uniref:DUF2740 domain-containing protein n=1 Tax=Erwinia phage Midgardsormr38 TaxID=2663326 RepID=A0A5Q2F537_9CAUD|nr:tail protein [Erwinia phage Midgardsormr38]QGF22019.1 protein of unknown function DUF2740 [Erwinia phage Midgardsormr38]
MTKKRRSYQDKPHKNILRDRYLCDFAQPTRLRLEWDRVKKQAKENGHE